MQVLRKSREALVKQRSAVGPPLKPRWVTNLKAPRM